LKQNFGVRSKGPEKSQVQLFVFLAGVFLAGDDFVVMSARSLPPLGITFSSSSAQARQVYGFCDSLD
jgi:hypothetical protein